MHVCIASCATITHRFEVHVADWVAVEQRAGGVVDASQIGAGVFAVGPVRRVFGQYDKGARVGIATVAGFAAGHRSARTGLYAGAVDGVWRMSFAVFGAEQCEDDVRRVAADWVEQYEGAVQ